MRALIILLLLGSQAIGREALAAASVGGALRDGEASRRTLQEIDRTHDDEGARWIDADGEPLPFHREVEILEYLRTAEVVSDKVISKGTNDARKLLLEKDGVQAHAVFRAVNEKHHKPGARFSDSFRDNCMFEVAAYKLDRFLGLHRVPPVVARKHDGKRGSLQIWVENAFDEQMRREQDLTPPDLARWSRQQALRRIFDALIYNHDRNLGNVLIDPRWNFWLIDHTRSFKPSAGLRDAKHITRCGRDLWRQLQTADRAQVALALDPYLTPQELRSLFTRWDKLHQHIGGLIADRGERSVLF